MMKTKIMLAALVILLTGCLIPFRVNAQGVRISETGKTDINRISQNGLPDDSQADMEKLKELEDKLHELEEAALYEIGGMKMEDLQQKTQEELEKDIEKARRNMIINYGLAFAAWTAAALVSIGLLVFVVLILMGKVHI